LANQWFVEPLGLDPDWNSSKFSSVNKWIRVIRRRGDSRATKQSYFKCLATFMRATRMNPDEIVDLTPEKAKEAIQDFCDGYAAKKRYSTAHIYLNCLRSFLRHNGKKDLELEDYAWKRSKRPERVPTKDEVYRMAEVSDLRDRAVLLCDFQSGLRNATLRALTYGDVKEQIESDAPVISVHVTPQLKERVPEACKENVEQYTFFGKKATEALRLYLEERKRRYGPIGDDEPLFRSHSNIADATARTQPITEDALQRLVKKAARKSGIKEWEDVRFHSLRKTFKAVLDAGFLGGGGQLAEDDKEYLMGHVLPSQKAPYHSANVDVLQERYMKLDWGGEAIRTDPLTSGLAKLNASGWNVDTLSDPEREAVVPFLMEKVKPKNVPPEIEKVRYQIVRAHAPQSQVARLLRESMTTADMNQYIEAANPIRNQFGGRIEEEKHRPKKRRRTALNGGLAVESPYETRIVTEEELVPLLDEGWEVIRELASGKIIVRRSNHLDE
jgi:integrase